MESIDSRTLRSAAAAVAAAGSLALLAWPVGLWAVVRRLEKPRYVVVRTLGSAPWWRLGWWREAIEVRNYESFLVAEVEVTTAGDPDDNLRSGIGAGFKGVAGYIFGKNSAVGRKAGVSEKISMTSPVAAELLPHGVYRVSFMMPSKYRMDTLPQPHDDAIYIKERPACRLAAIRWTGASPDKGKVAEMAQRLRAKLQAAGEMPHGHPMLWQYHPPFAPAFMRQNEVLLRVGKLQGVTRNYPERPSAAS